MVVIRLSRGGSKKRPFYNIIATDHHNRRDGRFLERLGHYNPMAAANEREVTVVTERVEFWASKGAQISPTVKRLLKQVARDAERGAAAEDKPRKSKKVLAAEAAAAAAAAEAKAEASEASSADAE